MRCDARPPLAGVCDRASLAPADYGGVLLAPGPHGGGPAFYRLPGLVLPAGFAGAVLGGYRPSAASAAAGGRPALAGVVRSGRAAVRPAAWLAQTLVLALAGCLDACARPMGYDLRCLSAV